MLVTNELKSDNIDENFPSSYPLRRRSKTLPNLSSNDTHVDSNIQRFTSYINTGSSIGPLTHVNNISQISRECKSGMGLLSDELKQLTIHLQQTGMLMTKITKSKQKLYVFKLDKDNSKIMWRSDAKSLSFDSIKDIRIGKMASNYMDEYNVAFNNKWITILYMTNKKLKIFNVVARNDIEFYHFYNCICGIVKLRKELMESMSLPDHEQFATIHWNKMVSEKKEDQLKDTLTFDQVKRLCDKFHIYCSALHLKGIFDKADVNHNKLLNFSEFQGFVKLLKTRDELTTIWNDVAKKKSTIDLECFSKFIYEIQGEIDLTNIEIKLLFEQYTADGLMNEVQFTRFLNEQPYLKDIVKSTDYSKPLNHYFIASSHNTYLLGKQYAETPSVEGYVKVLQQGCRCLEIDIWDGESGPVVCHGILTSSIPLSNVIKTIKKYAFMVSSYPLIISLEIHCNKENQTITSQLMKDIWGGLIYTSDDNIQALPSPNDLKHKIIIKVKKPKGLHLTSRDILNPADCPSKTYSSSSPYEFTSFSLSSSNESEVESILDTINKEKKGEEMSTLKLIPNVSANSVTRIKRMGLKKKAEIINSMFEISNIHGLKFRNFSLPESKTLTHCFSLNERKFESLYKDSIQTLSLNKHNRRFLMRVYPHTLRYNSTNFNPIKFWKSGVQMVATNWQTNDIGQQINLAMFQLTNQRNVMVHSGYLLKPKCLLEHVSKIKEIPLLYKNIQQLSPKGYNLQLKLLSGQLLPRIKRDNKVGNDFGPYIIVEFLLDDLSNTLVTPVNVVKNGYSMTSTSSRSLAREGNGFNPIWDMELNITLQNLDFAFIRFTVNTNDTQLATCCVKLDYLKSGYRHVPLYNIEGERFIFSTIFIYSRIEPLA